MNRFVSRAANAATWALAAMPMIALAGAVHAQEVKVPYGDLTQPAAATAFAHRVDAAAKTICASYYRPLDGLSRLNACEQAVRDEAMAKVGATQRRAAS